ncbi:MAG TPA: type II 3-dehydroquinate dehydratase [Saprospiraceae bacterium]|nr:type II 3-dehydroquinate dehydratase [Saprospiraceae bacterium]
MLPIIHIVNGPNLNLLHLRPPKIYGGQSFDDYLETQLRPQFGSEAVLMYFQSNAEGALIDYLQSIPSGCMGVILNPAAYTHYSLALADTVELMSLPIVEVHISNISEREPRRQLSLIRPHVAHCIEGKGIEGYEMAVKWLLKKREK